MYYCNVDGKNKHVECKLNQINTKYCLVSIQFDSQYGDDLNHGTNRKRERERDIDRELSFVRD